MLAHLNFALVGCNLLVLLALLTTRGRLTQRSLLLVGIGLVVIVLVSANYDALAQVAYSLFPASQRVPAQR